MQTASFAAPFLSATGRRGRARPCFSMLACVTFLSATPSFAQDASRAGDSPTSTSASSEPRPRTSLPVVASEQRPRAFIFLMAEHAPGGDYSDASGGVDISRTRATLDFIMPVSDKGALGVGFLSEYSIYDFDQGSGPTAFGEPWDDTTGQRINLRYSHTLDEQWSLSLAGGVESARETGASFDDSLLYTLAGGAQYTINKDLKVGLFAAAQTSLEDDTTFFAIPGVEWQFAEQWKLSAGIGRAPGLGVEWQSVDRQWNIGLRTRFESREFRLAEDNALAPGGVGADRRVPVYLDVDWNLSEQFSLNAMFGMSFEQRLKYQDSTGTTLDRTDMDPTPFFSFGVAFRF